MLHHKSILIVTTNHADYPSLKEKTGNWLGEITHFYTVVTQAGYTVDLCSPNGGPIPLDPKSMQLKDQVNAKLWADPIFRQKLEHTIPAAEVQTMNYSGLYYSGGHGVMWDLPENIDLQRISAKLYESGKIVSAVCHGVGGLLNIRLSDGNHLIAGKSLTGFSNMEERLSRKTKQVPFSLENQLKRRGGLYSRSFLPFRPYVVQTGRLITGQNPFSAKLVGEKVVETLSNI